MEFHKLDGQSYTNKYSGEAMYALESRAAFQANQEGYVILSDDGRVQNLNFFNHDLSEGLKHSFLRYKEVKHHTPGDQFENHHNVLFRKME